MKWFKILPILVLIWLIVPVNAENKTNLDLPLFPPEVPELADTGYRLSKGEVVICKIEMPEQDIWMTNSKYGGGVGVYTDGQDVRIYAVLDKGWFTVTPVLRVFSNGQKITDIPLDDGACGRKIEVGIAYQNDGTVKFIYRYGKDTEWKIAYTEVAGANKLVVKAVKAYDFEKKKVDGNSEDNDGIDHSNPYPTPTTKEDEKREKQEKLNMALAGLGGIALVSILAMSLNRRKRGQ